MVEETLKGLLHTLQLTPCAPSICLALLPCYLGNIVRLYGQRRSNGHKMGGAPLSLPKIRRNPLVEIIPINTGCLNQCTYCKTKHARGDLGSYPPQEIVQRAKQAFGGECVEMEGRRGGGEEGVCV